MDNVSLSKTSSLFWLGRYAERAYTLSSYIISYSDRMVDDDRTAYLDFCGRLGITETFADKYDFFNKIISDENNSFSISHSLMLAYDNAITLRDQIDTETVAYIQLAYNSVLRSFNKDVNIMDLQKILDYVMSFWGAADDFITDEDVRCTIKAGKFTERVDLFCRFEKGEEYISSAKHRLCNYIKRLDKNHSCDDLKVLLERCGSDFSETEQCILQLFR